MHSLPLLPREASCSPPSPSRSDTVLPFPSWGKAAGDSTAPISLLTGLQTIASAKVDSQKRFQQELFEKPEQAFTESLKICKVLPVLLASRGRNLSFAQQVLEKVYIQKLLVAFSWVFWFSLPFLHLATKKKGKYKRFLKHSKSYPCISLQYYLASQNQLEKSAIIVNFF